MTGAMPREVPPQARELVDAIAARPTAPVKAAVVGGMGTGKTSTLSAIRAALRGAGVEVSSRPGTAPQPGTAVVADDAHLLTDAELTALLDWAADPGATIVIATPPYQHHAALRALTLALQRESPPVRLGPLPVYDVHRAAGAVVGGAPPAEMMRALMTATAGVPFLVDAALSAVSSAEDGSAGMAIAQGARFALLDRLRAVDEPVLDALLIASLSPDLGVTDVAAA